MAKSMLNEMAGVITPFPTTQVRFGAGCVADLARVVEQVEGNFACIITEPSLFRHSDKIAYVKEVLGDELYVGEFTEVPPQITLNGIKRITKYVRTVQADLLISVGSASAIDAAKLVAHELAVTGSPYPRHIAIPTTLAASEFTYAADYTDVILASRIAIADTHVMPHYVLLDAAMTSQTSRATWFSTAIYALSHAIETLYAPGVHPANVALALEAIHQLRTGLAFYLEHTEAELTRLDESAVRTELQLGAWMSMLSCHTIPFGLIHNLGRHLMATYPQVSPATVATIALPVVMDALAESYSEALTRAAHAIIPGSHLARKEPAVIRIAQESIYLTIRSLGLPQHLSSVGIPEEDLHEIAIDFADDEGLPAEWVEDLLYQML